MTDLDEMRQRLSLLSDDELILMLREHDEEQWRPEVFDIAATILHGRGISLDEAMKAEAQAEEQAQREALLDEAEALDLATVASYSNVLDAESDRMALEAKGLQAWVVNGEEGVQLRVQRQDWRAALAQLGLDPEQPVPSTALPDDIAEPPCPKCGSRNVMEHAELADDSLGLAGPGTVWLYHCDSCGHEWNAE